ncbi:MAG: M28 family peptidase, partial [Candidatus Eremiobacteraeota bacterium]|nr:M28 family peptidase [Candidatus Eremiobacteraeota bacterium]
MLSALRAITALALIAGLTTTVAPASDTAIVGWPAGAGVASELAREQTLMRVPTAANALDIEHHLSSVIHRAGTPADYATAMYVKSRLEKDGFVTRVVPYSVWFTAPVKQRLEIVSPGRTTFDLIEGMPGHHTKWEKMAGPPFLEESGDGDVRGPLYYVNGATKDDFVELDAMGVNLRGAVVLVRQGGGSNTSRAFDPTYNAYSELLKRGVVGILLFTDPASDGFGQGVPWPNGNFKNSGMAERAGGLSPRNSRILPPGDPTLPGQAPLPGVAHKPWSAVAHSTMPEMNITQRVARQLLAGMTGAVVPAQWHPMFEFAQRVGGNQRVREAVTMTRHLITIWNVFGEMKGATDPASVVMIGSHRDAMTFGAIDPGSGTTVLLQDADAFGALAQDGWRPSRTIELASWDGHELGLYGSNSYAYQDGPNLRASVFQYINTDQLTTGDPFVISASPGLYAFMKQIVDGVPGVDGKMLGARDQRKRPLLNPISGGSDHQTFAYVLGVPSTSNGYYGAFGAHHTAEDNLDGLRTYDPGLKQAVIAAQVTGIQALRAAGATVSPLRIEEEPLQLQKDLGPLAPSLSQLDLHGLMAALEEFRVAAHATDLAMIGAEQSGNIAEMQALARKEQAARDAFFYPGGLTYNAYLHTIDRVFTSFPELAFAGPDKEVQKVALNRITSAVQSAT